MQKSRLGRLERVSLRDYWEREDTGFTPWLAQEENIALLGATIGLELEVVSQEVRVGPFRADILCHTPGNNHQVLIENQLEVTDHSHLGQLLTYAAGLEAVSIVWIAGKFTEEHRAALDWLNRITAEGVNFFGLEVELWRIGDSLAAPKFNLVSKPNDWAKSAAEVGRRGPENLSPGRQLQLDYWTEFNQFLSAQDTPFRPVKPQPESWLVYGMGVSFLALETVANLRAGWVGIRLSFSKRYVPHVFADCDEIEAEVGESMQWADEPGKTVGVILLTRPADLSVREQWSELHCWMLLYLERFAAAFKKRAQGYKARAQEETSVSIQ